MSEAAGLTGRHTNHSVRRTIISTLRKENVEPLNIIALAGQRNLKSLDSYSSTSTEQQKDMSLKLSSFIEVCEARNKSVAESQILTPRAVPQRDESEVKHLFTGAVFNNCQFTFSLPLPMLAPLPSMPQFHRRNSREPCPLQIVMMNYKELLLF